MHPCKHLDYREGVYGPGITLETAAPHFPEVRFWRRDATWTDNGPSQTPNPSKVQFCLLKGRINGVFQCYNTGELPCYEVEQDQ